MFYTGSAQGVQIASTGTTTRMEELDKTQTDGTQQGTAICDISMNRDKSNEILELHVKR